MNNEPQSTGIWESKFANGGEVWGMQAVESAYLTQAFFEEIGVKSVLIPGIGYGRNAIPFLESGMEVSGIEISKTAVELAHQHFGEKLKIHHGSVNDMPFDDVLYDGIYCYALIHLLDEDERHLLIQNCYNQLAEGGYMVFIMISKESQMYGQGQPIGKDRFQVFQGIHMYFYDLESIENEFGQYGLFEVSKVELSYPFFMVKCKKHSHKTV